MKEKPIQSLMSANQGTDNPSLLQSPNQFSVRTNVVSMGKAGLLLPSATVMLTSCVSPSVHWPITWSGPNDCRCTPIWWAVKWHLFTTKHSLYTFTWAIVPCPDLSVLLTTAPYHNSLFGSYCLLILLPSCLVYFISKDSLSEHNSTLSLCYGTVLFRTACIPIKRLLQQKDSPQGHINAIIA